MTTVTDEAMLLDLIAHEVEHANGSLDASDVAGQIVKRLSRSELERLSFKAARREVVDYLASLRPPTAAAGNGNGNGSGRWDQVREVRDKLDEWWVAFTDRESKPLLGCTDADLEDAAEWYEKRASGYAARAESYRKLAKTLKRAKVTTPADLPREQVRKILDA